MTLRRVRELALLVAACLASACTTQVKHAPFTDFGKSIAEVGTGADVVAKGLAARTKEDLISRLATGDSEAAARIQSLKLVQCQDPEGNPDPSHWCIPDGSTELLFLKLSRLRKGLAELNAGLATYATALAILASPELVDGKTFEALRADLNAGLVDAAILLRDEPEAEASSIDGFALFSTLATEAFREWVEAERQEALVEQLNANQTSIERAGRLGQEAAHILGNTLWRLYGDEAQDLLRRAIDGDTTQTDRKKAIQELVSLDDAFTGELQALDVLESAYGALAPAHATLADAVRNPEQAEGNAVLQLYTHGRRLHDAYSELAEANKKRALAASK